MKKALLIFVILAFAVSLFACSGPPKKATAVIKKLNLSDNIIRADRKGKLRTFHISSDTKYFRGDTEIKAADLQPGDKAEFEFQIKNKKRVVSKVNVLSGKAPATANPAEAKPGEVKQGEAKPEVKPEAKPAKEKGSEEEGEENDG
jgi:hypothetical protein